MKKKCSSCLQEKDINCFYKTKSNPDGYFGYCINCHNDKNKKRYYEKDPNQRNLEMKEYRARTNNSANKKYYKTLKGHIVRAYRGMLCRVSDKENFPTYYGLPIIGKKEFYEFSLSFPGIQEMYAKFVESGYQRNLAPSIDRINPKIGYIIGNMRWATQSFNSSQASVTSPHGFNMLGVRLGAIVIEKYIGKKGRSGRLWGYICDCGNRGTILSDVLMRKKKKHCGCNVDPKEVYPIPDWKNLPKISFKELEPK